MLQAYGYQYAGSILCVDVLFPPILTYDSRSLLVSVVVIVTLTNDMEMAPAMEFSDSRHEIGSTRGRDMVFVLVKALSQGDLARRDVWVFSVLCFCNTYSLWKPCPL